MEIEVVTVNIQGALYGVRWDGESCSCSCSSSSGSRSVASEGRRRYRLVVDDLVKYDQFLPRRRLRFSSVREEAEHSLQLEIIGDAKSTIHIPWDKVTRKEKYRGWAPLHVESSGGEIKAFRLHASASDDRPPILLLYANPHTTSFLADVPDPTPFGDLTLAGTHESCAFYGFPISQCQQPSTPIAQQLLDGIRFLDIRLRLVDDQLYTYHGSRPERTPFPALISEITDFLQAHPSEALLISLKDEQRHLDFSHVLYRDLRDSMDEGSWWVHDSVPTLGQVRGKAVLMSRFWPNPEDDSWSAGMGIVPVGWGNSRRNGFEWDCGGTRCRVQDWYGVASFLQIPEKFQTIIDFLESEAHSDAVCLTNNQGNVSEHKPPLTMSFSSAAAFPLSPPPIMARGFGWPEWGFGVEGINGRMMRWALGVLAGVKTESEARRPGGEVGSGARSLGGQEAGSGTPRPGGEAGSGVRALGGESGSRAEGAGAGVGAERAIRGIIPMDYYRSEDALAEVLVLINSLGR